MSKETSRAQLPPRKRLSLRMRDRERELVQLAASQRGVTFSEFLRSTATDAARRELSKG